MSYAHRPGNGDEQGAGACVGIQVGIAQVGGRILVFGTQGTISGSLALVVAAQGTESGGLLRA